MCAPKVVKIGCFLTEIFKKGGRFEGHGVVEKCDDGGVMCWQFEGAISSGGRGVVHHLEVFHCEAPPHVHIPYYNAPCSSKSQRPRGLESCRKVIGAWAMGAKVRVPHTRATIKSNSKPLIDGTVRLIRLRAGFQCAEALGRIIIRGQSGCLSGASCRPLCDLHTNSVTYTLFVIPDYQFQKSIFMFP